MRLRLSNTALQLEQQIEGLRLRRVEVDSGAVVQAAAQSRNKIQVGLFFSSTDGLFSDHSYIRGIDLSTLFLGLLFFAFLCFAFHFQAKISDELQTIEASSGACALLEEELDLYNLSVRENSNSNKNNALLFDRLNMLTHKLSSDCNTSLYPV